MHGEDGLGCGVLLIFRLPLLPAIIRQPENYVQGAFNSWQRISTPLLRRRLRLHTVFRLPIAGVVVGLRLLVFRSIGSLKMAWAVFSGCLKC
ncbi:hypothetical protein [Kingella oralis]|uniref:hypothetical protein n=1 Tax=Kingella oralis TaxID=505 RepID=UPI0012DE5BB0|nr:hypothetical protein [Kingella oralis]QMT42816.1 hypothetical protein H3L93_12930 [Kingella oralis]